MRAKKEITKLLSECDAGTASDELIEAVYQELHKIAKSQFTSQKPGHTLQPTALVNEAYARLFSGMPAVWENRRHFYGAAAEVMRNVMVDQARRKNTQKRGGGKAPERLDNYDIESPGKSDQVLKLDEALSRLTEKDPDAAELVKMRYFVRLTMQECAETLAISLRSANRLWAFARAWLHEEISEE